MNQQQLKLLILISQIKIINHAIYRLLKTFNLKRKKGKGQTKQFIFVELIFVSFDSFFGILYFQVFQQQFQQLKAKNNLERSQKQAIAMKFNKSDRVTHQENFNPPCNYYNPSDKINKQILYGSLAGPILHNKRMNTFGYQKRFQDKNTFTPGPGEYLKQQQKKLEILNLNTDKKPIQFLKETIRLDEQFPSIPCHYYDKNMNSEDLEYIKQLQLNQDVIKATQKIKKKEPAYSFSKSPRTTQKIITQKKIGNTMQGFLQKISENIKQKAPQAKSKQKPALLWQQAIKKSSQKRSEIINHILPDFVPSLQIIDIMSKQRTRYNPGPGAYQNIQENQINLIKKKGVVFSSQKRFAKQTNSKLGPGSYNIKQTKTNKGIAIDRTKRQVFNLKEQTDLYHRFYINPNPKNQIKLQDSIGIAYQESKLRSSSCISLRRLGQMNSTPFGSCSRRFSIDTRASQNDQVQKKQISQYQMSKKQNFKKLLKKKLKKLQKQDRNQNSGLLGISTMASTIDF